MAGEVDYNYKGGNGWQFKGSTGFDWGYRLTSPGGVVLSAAGGDSDSGAAMRAICREADQQAARIAKLEQQVTTLRSALHDTTQLMRESLDCLGPKFKPDGVMMPRMTERIADNRAALAATDTTCPDCNGSGSVKKYPNNPGSGFTVPCLSCKEARND